MSLRAIMAMGALGMIGGAGLPPAEPYTREQQPVTPQPSKRKALALEKALRRQARQAKEQRQ